MSKKIWISAPNGLILSAAAMDSKKDVAIGAHEPAEVPEGYGRHLIADRFAVEVDKPKAAPEKAQKKATVTKSDEDAARKLSDAEKAVSDAEAAVIAAGDDLAKKAEAEKALEAAKAALAALKA
jgi:hypothetical protein